MKVIRLGITGSLLLLIWYIFSSPLSQYKKAFLNNKAPQLVLVLGGDINREYIGIKIAKSLNIPIVFSGGSNPEYANWLINKEGLNPNLAILDYRPQDTFSNFTSIVDELKNNKIDHTIVVTSEDHVNRAMSIGHLIAGSRGIKLTSLPVDCRPSCEKESTKKYIFDVIRAINWIITGKDPKSFIDTNLQKY
tara:strand:+ start:2385 stop:2960 length:576 start_codon:yes stop_codon:yes gene_type:complete